MLKQCVYVLLAGITMTAGASSITFQPTSQTINLGDSALVNVQVSGITRSQALGAFDLLVLNDPSILRPTAVTFFNSLGDPFLELTGSALTSGSVEAAETSFEDTSTLSGLQAGQPFLLFELTYSGIGVGTSSLTLGANPEILADGSGAILTLPTVTAGSITVLGGTPPPTSVTPEPSSFALLASGAGALMTAVKRRRVRG